VEETGRQLGRENACVTTNESPQTEDVNSPAHLARALGTRARAGDRAQAAAYRSDIAYAQVHGPSENGPGMTAASRVGLTDCEGDSVYASLHTGTTAWYILAARGINPLSATTPISAQ
jgi:hypothetical protein